MPAIGSEFVCTSLCAGGPPAGRFEAMLPDNPHIRFYDGSRRGYALATITPESWRTDFRVVEDVRDPESGSSTLASFVVEAGSPGAKPA
jgi:alkaline phosphatase D